MRFRIPCGKTYVDIDAPADALVHSRSLGQDEPLADASQAVESSLCEPIGSAPLAEMARGRKSAVIVISDITRPAPNKTMLPAVLQALESAGMPDGAVTILIATGLHREALPQEIDVLVGENVAARYRVVSHNARNQESLVYLGESVIGAPIWLNKLYVESNLKIVTGLIEPHFMAGFSGGRKGVCPGIAGADTICAFHSVELTDHPESRTANLTNNPVHIMSEEVAGNAGIDFLVNMTVDREGRATGVFAGDYLQAFSAGAEYARRNLTRIYESSADLVITSAGGWPLDATFYQSVKGIYAGAQLVRQGGDVLVIAGCDEGMGSEDYADLMRHVGTCEDFAEKIRFPGYFTIDQWQVQKHCQAARRGRIVFYTPGLRGEPLDDFLVESVDYPQGVVDEFLRNTLGGNIAIIPEGPYVIPTIG